MKGIILAGGSGSRLRPITLVINKQLLPVYDKPMIYYPLSNMILSGITEILIISTHIGVPLFRKLFGDGEELGISISYAMQHEAYGIADAFIIGQNFIKNDTVCLMLGDNIFHGDGLSNILQKATKLKSGGLVFGYKVSDPERYGVLEFNRNNQVIGIEEKPKIPKSKYVVPGIYFYDNDVVRIAKALTRSARGELEITDINNHYLNINKLQCVPFNRGFTWLDMGTHESLSEASSFIEIIEKRQGLKIGCIEESSWRMGYILNKHLLLFSKRYDNAYGKYLLDLSTS